MLVRREFSPLAARRRAFGINQESLARHVGISGPQLSKIENGVHDPERSLQEALAAALGTSVDTIFPDTRGQPGGR